MFGLNPWLINPALLLTLTDLLLPPWADATDADVMVSNRPNRQSLFSQSG